MMSWLRRLHEDEAGHNAPFGAGLVGIVAAIALTWGIVGDIDWLTIVGGVAVGVMGITAGTLTHVEVDYQVMERLDALESEESGDD